MLSIRISVDWRRVMCLSKNLRERSKKRAEVLYLNIVHGGDSPLILEVVPNSGTEALAGISGTMEITLQENGHEYVFGFEGGMAFERYEEIEKYDPSSVDASWNWLIGDNDDLETRTSTDYFGIPFRFVWNSEAVKTRFIASVGFTRQLLLSRKTRDTYFKDGEGTDWNTKSGMSDFNISPMMGIGAEHSLSERFFIRSEAIARFGVLSLEEYAPLTSYIYSAELNIGPYLNLFEIEKSYWSY